MARQSASWSAWGVLTALGMLLSAGCSDDGARDIAGPTAQKSVDAPKAVPPPPPPPPTPSPPSGVSDKPALGVAAGVATTGAGGTADANRSAPATGAVAAGQAGSSIALSMGVALAQTGLNGTLMSFSVDYQLAGFEPSSSTQYVWVIERSHGAPAKQPVQLQERGTLTGLIEQWRPADGPFQTHLEDQSGNRLSPSIALE